jgi:hypothetical protein
MLCFISKNIHDKVFFIFKGIVYTRQGFYGCQLKSFEWKPASIGDTREIVFSYSNKMKFYVYRQERKWFRYEILWTLARPNQTTAELENEIAELLVQLKAMV